MLLKPHTIILLLSSVVQAQGFNIDIGPASATVPGAMCAGAAGQPGYWNGLSGTTTLADLSGGLTSVVAATSLSLGSLPIPGAAPGDKELMESMLFGDRNSTAQVGVQGLAPGVYRLYVYGWSPFDDPNPTMSRIAIDETTSGSFQIVETHFNNIWSGHVSGVTFATSEIEVQATGGLLLFTLLSLGNGEDSPVSVLNGIQIVPIPAPTTAVMALVLWPLASCRRR